MLRAGLQLWLPRRYKLLLPWSPLVLFSLAFFIPLLGTTGCDTGGFASTLYASAAETADIQLNGGQSCRSVPKRLAETRCSTTVALRT